ncbi:MAG TPA: MgtC/SapB family protein [Ignavibacteriaceae bacterium]|nr:MgtC/SapB family protein [Ignavibacteriaceae bacterium]
MDTLNVFQHLKISPEPLLESGDLFTILQGLGAVIFIGLLIGLEREHSRSKDQKIFAGIRTFPLIGILGFLTALTSSLTSEWVYVAVMFGFSGLLITAYLTAAKDGRLGGTSEVSALLVFILGTMVYYGYILLPAIIAIVITIFLSLKIQLHTFVGKISGEDIFATLKLAIISIIILPLLPDRTFGPFDVLNPRLIWYMVIFISGISFVGYFFIKLLGKDRGIILTGLLGGLVSSTAVAFSLSKKSVLQPLLSYNYAIGIVLASTMMFIRVFIIVLVLNSALVSNLWIPLLIFTIAGYIISRIMYKKESKNDLTDIEISNPFELKSAFLFGLLFAAVIFGAKAAQVYLGDQGIYAASALAGLTSVDAIVLSISKLSTENLVFLVAEKAIIIALISNTIVKILITVIWGSIELRKAVIKGLGFVLIIPLIYLITLFIF